MYVTHGESGSRAGMKDSCRRLACLCPTGSFPTLHGNFVILSSSVSAIRSSSPSTSNAHSLFRKLSLTRTPSRLRISSRDFAGFAFCRSTRMLAVVACRCTKTRAMRRQKHLVCLGNVIDHFSQTVHGSGVNMRFRLFNCEDKAPPFAVEASVSRLIAAKLCTPSPFAASSVGTPSSIKSSTERRNA